MKKHTINTGWTLDQKLIAHGVHAHLLAGILLAEGKVSGDWDARVFGGRYFPLEADPVLTARHAVDILFCIGFLDLVDNDQTYKIIDPAYLTEQGGAQ